MISFPPAQIQTHIHAEACRPTHAHAHRCTHMHACAHAHTHTDALIILQNILLLPSSRFPTANEQQPEKASGTPFLPRDNQKLDQPVLFFFFPFCLFLSPCQVNAIYEISWYVKMFLILILIFFYYFYFYSVPLIVSISSLYSFCLQYIASPTQIKSACCTPIQFTEVTWPCGSTFTFT